MYVQWLVWYLTYLHILYYVKGKEAPLEFLLEYDVERERGGEVDLYQAYTYKKSF